MRTTPTDPMLPKSLECVSTCSLETLPVAGPVTVLASFAHPLRYWYAIVTLRVDWVRARLHVHMYVFLYTNTQVYLCATNEQVVSKMVFLGRFKNKAILLGKPNQKRGCV